MLKDHLSHLRGASESELKKSVVGIDLGIKRSVQAGDVVYKPSVQHSLKKEGLVANIKRLQKRMSRQVKDSKRRAKTKSKISSSGASQQLTIDDWHRCWALFFAFCAYKAERNLKAVFKNFGSIYESGMCRLRPHSRS